MSAPPAEPCPACKGTGYTYFIPVLNPAAKGSSPCKACKGTGKIEPARRL